MLERKMENRKVPNEAERYENKSKSTGRGLSQESKKKNFPLRFGGKMSVPIQIQRYLEVEKYDGKWLLRG